MVLYVIIYPSADFGAVAVVRVRPHALQLIHVHDDSDDEDGDVRCLPTGDVACTKSVSVSFIGFLC